MTQPTHTRGAGTAPAGFRTRCAALVPALLLASALALAGCTGGPGARDGEVWRFAIEETRGSVQDAYAQKFKELVEERSGGEVTVKVYPYGTLGTSDQMTEQLHSGTIEFVMSSPGHLGKLIPEVQVFLLHFVFSDDEEVNHRALRDPELLAAFDALYAEKGLKLLDFISEGWQVWTTGQPVREPADFGGVKFRVMTSPLLIAAYDAYGASPTPLPYSEVYSALQLNMIDGQVNPVFAIEEMSFYEVTDYLIFARHAQFVSSAVTAQAFYEELSPERRALVQGVVRDLHDHVFDVQRDFNRDRLETIRERKPGIQMIELTEEQRERFRRASLPVRDVFADMVGPRGEEVLELVLEAVREAEGAVAPRQKP